MNTEEPKPYLSVCSNEFFRIILHTKSTVDQEKFELTRMNTIVI